MSHSLFSCILNVNGEDRHVDIRAAETLLDVLRSTLGLTGTKPGCKNGDCGACTVLVNNKPVKSCIMLSIQAVNTAIITIEGLEMPKIQEAFIIHNAFQCGYCTPGFIMNTAGLVIQEPFANDQIIEEWLQSNICRCTSYEEIKAAVQSIMRKS